MIDYGKVVATVYDECLSPNQMELPLQWVLREIELVDASLCTDLDLTNQLWRVKQWPLPIDGFVDEYRFLAPDFSRAIMAEVSPRDGARTRRRIQIADITDQDRYATGSDDYFSGINIGSLGFSIEEVGFFRRDGDLWARVSPPPSVSFDILVHYEPSILVNAQSTQTPGAIEAAANAAFPFLARRVAFNILSGLSHKPENVIQRKLRALDAEIGRCQIAWDQFRMQDNQEENTGIVEGFTLGKRVAGRSWLG